MSVPPEGGLVVVGHHTGLELTHEARCVLVAQPKLLLSLYVDHRRSTLVKRHLIGPLQRRAEVCRGGHILAMRAERLSHLVVPQVLLEQMDRESDLVVSLAFPGTHALLL